MTDNRLVFVLKYQGAAMDVIAHITRKEFDELKEVEEAMEKRQIAMELMLRQVHDALMLPQPGQTKSLLDRMAAVTNGVEAGQKSAKFVIYAIALLAALGFSVHFGLVETPK